jgi:hypothetical protein
MTMKKIFYFLMVLSAISISAQSTQSNLSNLEDHKGSFGTNYEGFWARSTTLAKKVKGSPYLLEDWNTKAVIFSTSGDMFKIDNLNYDTTKERFVVKMTKDSVFVFDSSTIQKVILNRKMYKPYINNGEKFFYQNVASAKGVAFLKKSFKLIKKAGKVDLFTDTGEKYVLKTNFYIHKDDEIQKIKPKNKYFLKFFNRNDASKIKEYISNNKLSIKNDSDLKKIFHFYEQL